METLKGRFTQENYDKLRNDLLNAKRESDKKEIDRLEKELAEFE